MIPLHYDRGLTILPHRLPTEKELLELEYYDLTSEERPWNSKEAKEDSEWDLSLALERIEARTSRNHGAQNRRVKFIHTKTTRNIDWTDKQIERWQACLGYVSPRVAKETLANTTQLVILEEESRSYSIMQGHLKARFPLIHARHFKDDVMYVDVMHLPETQESH